ncbi:MAG: UDP-N-acetylmuramate dehydrogenase [Candidatus Kapabacteria bacterium]|nr:UDP-N-acetylmuramate dehydrogenase [Candidatus Kapabacteria bacterium]
MIEHHKDLTSLTTFHVPAVAEQYCKVTTIDEARSVIQIAKEQKKSLKILGGGSNILLTKDLNSLVLHTCIDGMKTEVNTSTTLLTVNAGVEWHSLVSYCVENSLGGIENLALIPGFVGAAPIQNIGAYGVEIADVLESVTLLDLNTLEQYTLSNSECKFGYRDSIFKRSLAGKVLIVSVSLLLTNTNHKINYSYKDVALELELHSINTPTIADVFSAVVSVRKRKLPDPNVLGNAGSFFKNPVIPKTLLEEIQRQFPTIPSYKYDDENVKVAAAFLIENVGMKGYRSNEVGTHIHQPLVLVNYGNGTGGEVLELAHTIIEKVKSTFGITLQTEVNIW